MAVRKINESTLTAIGNAIRSKTGGSALINPEDMADEIDSIQTGGGGARLPAEYQEVEWISNANSTAYISFEFGESLRNANTAGVTFEIDAKFDSVLDHTQIICGNNSNGGCWFGMSSAGVLTLGGGNDLSGDYSQRKTYTVTFTTSGVTVSDGTNTATRTGNANGKYGLFNVPSNLNFITNATMYSCKIYGVGGVLVRDLVPCYRKADNVVGLCDRLTGTFYTSATSGTFTKGADV